MGLQSEGHLRAQMNAITREAGAVAMSYFGGKIESWDKSHNNPVSEADIAVDNLLKDKLCGLFPEAAWLSEESADYGTRLDKRWVWVVDPIDGTRAFLKNLPEFSVSVALTCDGKPVMAAVFNPATEEFFEAETGQGALLNGAPLRVSPYGRLEGARLFAHAQLIKSRKWPEKWPQVQIQIKNSIAYRICLVAAGQADGSITLNRKNDWDIAAGDLIVTEAGGVITDHLGQKPLYNKPYPEHRSVIAAGPVLHRLLVEKAQTLELE